MKKEIELDNNQTRLQFAKDLIRELDKIGRIDGKATEEEIEKIFWETTKEINGIGAKIKRVFRKALEITKFPLVLLMALCVPFVVVTIFFNKWVLLGSCLLLLTYISISTEENGKDKIKKLYQKHS